MKMLEPEGEKKGSYLYAIALLLCFFLLSGYALWSTIQYNGLTDRYNTLADGYNNLSRRYENLYQWKVERKDPTYDQFIAWLEEDDTNELPFQDNTFDCDDYVRTLVSNGKNNGWDMGVVIIDGEEVGHTMAAIRLRDQGEMWIEAQTDEVMEPKRVGEWMEGLGIIQDVTVIW